MKFGLFFIGRIHRIRTISALMVTLFFGGWQGPVVTAIHLVRAENRVLYDDVYFDSCVVTAVRSYDQVMSLRLENLPAADADQLAGNGGCHSLAAQ